MWSELKAAKITKAKGAKPTKNNRVGQSLVPYERALPLPGPLAEPNEGLVCLGPGGPAQVLLLLGRASEADEGVAARALPEADVAVRGSLPEADVAAVLGATLDVGRSVKIIFKRYVLTEVQYMRIII